MKENIIGRKAALEMISSINAVEGFDPTAVVRKVAGLEGVGEKEQFLPLIWKKAWARKVYPLHRCHAKIIEVTDDMVAAYAAFYIDNSKDKEAIGEGFAFVSIDAFAADRGKARSDAVLKALGSAKSRAFTDAGFGLQFWIDDCIDDLQTASDQDQTVKTMRPLSAMVELAADSADLQQSPSSETVVTDGASVVETKTDHSQMTVFMMSLEDAKNVISSCGNYSGMTMGQLYENKVTRQLLPKLFERTDEKNERLAIRTIIESDTELIAYCRRNRKVLDA